MKKKNLIVVGGTILAGVVGFVTAKIIKEKKEEKQFMNSLLGGDGDIVMVDYETIPFVNPEEFIHKAPIRWINIVQNHCVDIKSADSAMEFVSYDAVKDCLRVRDSYSSVLLEMTLNEEDDFLTVNRVNE